MSRDYVFTSVATSPINEPMKTKIPSGSLRVRIANGGFQILGGQTVNVELGLYFRNGEILAENGYLTRVATAKVV